MCFIFTSCCVTTNQEISKTTFKFKCPNRNVNLCNIKYSFDICNRHLSALGKDIIWSRFTISAGEDMTKAQKVDVTVLSREGEATHQMTKYGYAINND